LENLAMGERVIAPLAACAAIGIAVGAQAHHSVAGQFDAEQRTTITGTITKVDWINPHVYVYLDVADEQGAVTTWRLESLPTAMLRKAGLTSELIKGGGQKVTAEAILARNGTPHLAWLLKLSYEDGHYYQLAGE
jgi:hypothetical protein